MAAKVTDGKQFAFFVEESTLERFCAIARRNERSASAELRHLMRERVAADEADVHDLRKWALPPRGDGNDAA